MQNCPDDSAFSDEENQPVETLPKSTVKGQKFGAHAPILGGNTPAFRVSRSRGETLSPAARRAGDAINATVRSINHDRPKRPGVQAVAPFDVLESYLGDYLADGEYHGQSPLTLRGKKEAVEKLLWFLGHSNMTRCGVFEIKRFLSHVQNGHLDTEGRFGTRSSGSYRAVGERTLQLYFVYIKGYLTWLCDEDLISAHPLLGVRQPRARKPLIHPLSIEEVALLLSAIRKIHNHARNEAIIYFLLDTGVRVAEMCDILAGDLDLARGVVTVTGKGRKKREVWFGRDTASVLKKYLSKHPRERDEAFFYSERPRRAGDGLTTDGVRRLLSRWAKLAGLSGKRVSPHTFRHTFATEFIKSGGMPKALQMLLGHEDMEMTYRYVSLSESDAAAQHRQHSPARLLRGAKKR